MKNVIEIFHNFQENFTCTFSRESVKGILQNEQIDRAISINLLLSTTVGGALIVLFLLIRQRFKKVYFGKAVNSGRREGRIGVSSLFYSSDLEVIRKIGVDKFVFLGTLKLLLWLLLGYSFVAVTVLIPIYASNGVSWKNVFISTTILNVADDKRWTYWVVLVVSWLFQVFAMMNLQVFYERVVQLRRQFLGDPEFLHSEDYLEELQSALPSGAQNLLSSSKATVVAKYLPRDVNSDGKLAAYLELLRVGTVKRASFVRRSLDFGCMLVERHKLVIALEGAFVEALRAATQKIATAIAQASEQSGESLAKMIAEHFPYDSFTTAEKEQLIGRLLETEGDLIRPRRRRSFFLLPKRKGCDAIKLYLEKVQEIEGRLQEYHKLPQESAESTPEEPLKCEKEFSLLSPLSFLEMFSSLRWGRYFKGTAIVTFEGEEQANLVKQCLVEEENVETKFIAAPFPNDIIWRNLSDASRNSWWKIFCACSYICIICFWTVPIALLSYLTEYNHIVRFFGEGAAKNARLRDFWSGAISPAILSGFVSLVPTFLDCIAIKRGYISRTQVSCQSARMYGWFLFIQPFLFTLLSGTIFNSFHSLSKGEFCRVLQDFQETLLKKSGFFFNLVIQRSTIELALVLLRPVDLICKTIFCSRIGSPTARTDCLAAPTFQFSYAVPKAISLFPMIVIYGCTSPILLMGGVAYYSLSWLCHGYSFLNVFAPTLESGAMYWPSNYEIVYASIILTSISTTVQLLLVQAYLPALIHIVSVIYVIWKGRKIRKENSKKMLSKPISRGCHRDAYSEKPTEATTGEKDAVANEEEPVESVNSQTRISTRTIRTQRLKNFCYAEDPYQHPANYTRRQEVFLPKGFFSTLKYYFEVFLPSIPTLNTELPI